VTWSYNPQTLSTSNKDNVRLLIGDTYASDQQMQDEEINYYLTQRATVYGAAAECCRTLASKFSRSVDLGSGANKASYSQLSKQYIARASEFDAKAAQGGAGVPYAGGISIADKQQQELNGDRVDPQFVLGMDDNLLPFPSAGNETEDQGSQ
jgi:hypothetical protein